jgi:tRNA pseudouridine32 synthase/23S rRNA pseudouridine746 synthase
MLIHPLATSDEKPKRFNNPFDYEPHPLCQQAADEVLRYVESEPQLLADALQGKMFGVLIVEEVSESSGNSGFSGYSGTTNNPGLFFIAAYSGLLAGRNDWPYFVPPVFDAQQPDGHFKQTERHISSINAQLVQYTATLSQSTETQSAILALKQQRKQLSEELQLWLFHQYRMLNAHGEVKDLVDIWRDYHASPKIQQRFPLPPGGSGDCCAPKLLQYAYRQRLMPVAIAEFWYGQSPRGEVRHHRQFYPACRGKCLPILTFMLQGLDVEPTEAIAGETAEKFCQQLITHYEDADLLVIEKPSGLLSVPGRIAAPSVQSILTERYGTIFMPHRLDMDTSGLMVVARTEEAYKHLQQQFYARTIYKRYEALLDGPWPASLPKKGTVSLPLRPAPLDRPRQVVDLVHGKQAITDYEVLSSSAMSLVSLTPHTGRTHQLRLHCAHPDGLGLPIVGDILYGSKAHRLCLHAAQLDFDHPSTGKRLYFCSHPDFFPSDML